LYPARRDAGRGPDARGVAELSGGRLFRVFRGPTLAFWGCARGRPLSSPLGICGICGISVHEPERPIRPRVGALRPRHMPYSGASRYLRIPRDRRREGPVSDGDRGRADRNRATPELASEGSLVRGWAPPPSLPHQGAGSGRLKRPTAPLRPDLTHLVPLNTSSIVRSPLASNVARDGSTFAHSPRASPR
jgi:hypothetical protein